MLRPRAIQPAEKSSGFRAAPLAPRRPRRVAPVRPAKAPNSKCAEVGRRAGRIELSVPKIAGPAAALLGLASARAQDKATTPSRPWLDPALLAAAKSEGSLIVYSSTNEQEGLPLFKLFTDATGIKVEYVRASDAVLMSRMGIEFRADQKSYDIVQTATINKMPAQMLAAYEPPEANHISPNARDPNQRWYGVYANYNSPAYNTERVKVSELPRSYEEFAQRKEWAGKVAIDGTDNEWLKAIVQYYGERDGIELVKRIVA